MLKKRILASSMASVMALSSVSVVAFADEKKDYGESVSKAELEEYIESLESFMSDELDAFGEIQGKDFTNAVDHANNVLENGRSTAADFAAAYQMVKTVKKSLTIYTEAQLKVLIKECKGDYSSDNVLNEDLEDKIYTDDTFSEFKNAYEDAEGAIGSEDDRITTDAYVALDKARNKLSKLKTVSKQDFRTALQAYESLNLKMADYEPWRRGTCTVKSSKSKATDASKLTSAIVTYGDLYEIVYGASTSLDLYRYDGTAFVALADGGKTWVGGGDDFVAVYDSTSIKSTIRTQYDKLDEQKGALETSDAGIYAAYEACLDAVKVFNGWKPDSYDSATKSVAKALEKKYHAQLVETYNIGDIIEFKAAIEALDVGTSTVVNPEVKLDADKHTMKTTKTIVTVVDKDTGKIVLPDGTSIGTDTGFYKNTTLANAAIADPNKYDAATAKKVKAQTITASDNILDFISYTVVPATSGGLETSFDAAVTACADLIASSDIDTAENGTKKYYQASATKAFSDFSGNDYYKVKVDTTTATGTQAAASKHNAAVEYLAAMKTAFDNADVRDTQKVGGVDIVSAMDDYNAYLSFKFTGDTKQDDIDAAKEIMEDPATGLTVGGPKLQSFTGSGKEWTLIHRQLAYALNNMYPVAKKTDKTLAKLKDLIDSSYEYTELTGDSETFNVQHQNTVTAREEAINYWKEANAEGKKINLDTFEDSNNNTIEDVYGELDKQVGKLKKVLKEFAYSYDEIRKDIGNIAIAVDKGEVKGDALVAALNKCAYDLSVLEASKLLSTDTEITNIAFNDERKLQAANRLKTGKESELVKVDPNNFEKTLKTSYEALTKAYEAAKKGEEAFTIKSWDDVNKVITAYTGDKDSKYDMNGDKVVDFADVNAAVQKYLDLQSKS